MDEVNLDFTKEYFYSVLKGDCEIDIKLNALLNFCDDFLRKNYEKFNLKEIDCRAGCGHCCILNIATLEPEIKNIINYINSNFDDTGRRSLKEKIKESYFMVKGLDDEERIFLRKKCVFLTDTFACSIYPVRPILCRSVTSTSAERCRESIAAACFGEKLSIISNLYVKELYLLLFNTFTEYLERENLFSKSKKLTVWLKEYMECIED
ncbi:MAG: hypothetical protein PWQ25_1233 [Deferribacteres bacterium]|jgi:Fe-S-cluster containining protein|nr:hypothetical protein [Deferribacteraceae bacterium]MDK2792370.1 hypothetical protein [Deferribacteres bacterium]